MKIVFYRNGKNYYYVYDGKEYFINEISINKLKEKLKLPFTFLFEGMSIAQVQKVCGRFQYDNVQYSFQTVNNGYKVYFFEKKRFVDVYLMNSKTCLFGRNSNCKPYILDNIGDKKILMEVTFDFINNMDCDYYFLHSELTQEERDFFCTLYERLEVDYVYNIKHEKRNILRRKK